MADGPLDTNESPAGTGTTTRPANTPGVTMPVDFARDASGSIVRDRRYVVRAERQKARKARMIRERTEREARENAVLAIAAGGASWPFIAQQLGVSVRRAREIHASAAERIGKESTAEFVAATDHRYAVLLQSMWNAAISGNHEARVDALRTIDQWTKLRGGYPAAQVDLSGDVTVRKEVSIREAVRVAADIQAGRILRGEVPMPELGPVGAYNAYNAEGPVLNGHDVIDVDG